MSTREEVLTGKKPEFSHFNIFVSFVYVHVTEDAKKKLELIVEIVIFVGYTKTPCNYRVYFRNNRMTVV